MLVAARTPQDWFEDASRCYVDKHQGCAWCGGVHQVYRINNAGRVSYYCQGCDFQATHDLANNRYLCIPGEDAETVRRTAYQI